MENIKRYRGVALLCRQQVALHPEASWHWLAEAEHYEHLADAAIVAYFKECNGGAESSDDVGGNLHGSDAVVAKLKSDGDDRRRVLSPRCSPQISGNMRREAVT